MEKLFAYGSLQDEEIQQAVFKRTLQGEADSLYGYELIRIRIPDDPGGTFYPAVKASNDKNSIVKGMVFKLEDKELPLADRYEGNSYRREKLMLDSGTKAWVYIFSS